MERGPRARESVMELREFVQESLVQIVRGIEGATKELGDTTAVVSPRYIRPASVGKSYGFAYEGDRKNTLRPVESVEFDVAVVALEGTEKKGGIGIMVGSIAIGGHGKTEFTPGKLGRFHDVRGARQRHKRGRRSRNSVALLKSPNSLRFCPLSTSSFCFCPRFPCRLSLP